MTPGMFRGRPLARGLRVEVRPHGVFQRPVIFVEAGAVVVAYFLAPDTDSVTGVLYASGIFGSDISDYLTAADLCELMGWTMPESMRAAA